MKSYGWICPQCGKVNAPSVASCCYAPVTTPVPFTPHIPWQPWRPIETPWYDPSRVTITCRTTGAGGILAGLLSSRDGELGMEGVLVPVLPPEGEGQAEAEESCEALLEDIGRTGGL